MFERRLIRLYLNDYQAECVFLRGWWLLKDWSLSLKTSRSGALQETVL